MAEVPKAKQRAEQQHEFPIPFVTRKTTVLLTIRVVGSLFLIELAYVALRLAGTDAGIETYSSLWVFLLFAAVQLVVAGFFYLRWLFETYEIHDDDIHHNRGILFRHERTYPYNNIQTMTCRLSPLGRIYHYGEVSLYIPTLGQELTFKEVPHPHHFLHTVRHVMPYPDRARFIIQ